MRLFQIGQSMARAINAAPEIDVNHTLEILQASVIVNYYLAMRQFGRPANVTLCLDKLFNPMATTSNQLEMAYSLACFVFAQSICCIDPLWAHRGPQRERRAALQTFGRPPLANRQLRNAATSLQSQYAKSCDYRRRAAGNFWFHRRSSQKSLFQNRADRSRRSKPSKRPVGKKVN